MMLALLFIIAVNNGEITYLEATLCFSCTSAIAEGRDPDDKCWNRHLRLVRILNERLVMNNEQLELSESEEEKKDDITIRDKILAGELEIRDEDVVELSAKLLLLMKLERLKKVYRKLDRSKRFLLTEATNIVKNEN